MYDVIIVGSGTGGLSAACILAQQGKKVLILEAAKVPGGCSSSFKRKGYIFESGATTLMGFDAQQPLHYLQQTLNLEFPIVEINPSMTVWQHQKPITRYKSLEDWISEAERCFGKEGQRQFWELAHKLSELIWKVALKNKRFPPTNLLDLVALATRNSILDIFALKYLSLSVYDVLKKLKLDKNEAFVRFIDEQLLITAQSGSKDVSMFVAGAMLCYTNYSNFYSMGGLRTFVDVFVNYLTAHQGEILYKHKVNRITQDVNQVYKVYTEQGNCFESTQVITNLPIWNLPELVDIPELKTQFEHKATAKQEYWSAFSVGIVVKDTFPKDFTLHHQVILKEPLPILGGHSVFISISHPEDTLRNGEGVRILNVSTHAPKPTQWFEPDFPLAQMKETLHQTILQAIEDNFPYFKLEDVVFTHASTPVTWQKWVHRKFGNVGGIPQSMKFKPWKAFGAKTHHKNFFICGDTTYPGQGITGVALSGILAAYRALKVKNK